MNEYPLTVLAVDDDPPQLEDLARILRVRTVRTSAFRRISWSAQCLLAGTPTLN